MFLPLRRPRSTPLLALATSPGAVADCCFVQTVVDIKTCDKAAPTAPPTCDADAAHEQVRARACYTARLFSMAHCVLACLQLLRQLSAAAALPLPSLPASAPAAAPAPVRTVPSLAADRSPSSQDCSAQPDTVVRSLGSTRHTHRPQERY